jgi:hypothetical protein
MNDEKNSEVGKRWSPLCPGMGECEGYIPAKFRSNENLLNKKSGNQSKSWDHTISDRDDIVNPFWKMKIMSYDFWRVPSSIKLRPKKKVQLSGRRLECLGVPWARIVLAGSLIKLPPEKRYSRLAIGCNVWEVGSMSSDCFGRFVAMFFGEFLDQITNYDRKNKGTVVWSLVGMSTTYFWLITP